MSFKSKQLGGTHNVLLNLALTLTGTPASAPYSAPFNQTIAAIQAGKLTEWISTGEVWRPLGVEVRGTTTMTTTAPVYTLQKAASSTTAAGTFASASSGGVATGSLLVAGASCYYPFTNYFAPTATAPNATNFTADAANDQWRVSVTTSPVAGAGDIFLHYATIAVAGISEAVATI